MNIAALNQDFANGDLFKLRDVMRFVVKLEDIDMFQTLSLLLSYLRDLLPSVDSSFLDHKGCK